MPGPIESGALPDPAPPPHEIIKIPDVGEPGRDALKQQCFDVRIAVFMDEQGFPLECEIDEADESATHFLVRLIPSLLPIGTIRPIRKAEGTYKLTRLAVLKDYRKFRLGRELVLALHDWVAHDALKRGASPGSYVKCVAHSQIPVMPFYAKYGYEPEGPEFDEDGKLHRKVVVQFRVREPVAPLSSSTPTDAGGERENEEDVDGELDNVQVRYRPVSSSTTSAAMAKPGDDREVHNEPNYPD